MLDVRRLAEARAAKGTREIGSGVESERKRAREAARMEANFYQGQNVQRVEAASGQQKGENNLLNVCAYCRVSTDDIGQIISIEYQKNTYRDKIRSNPRWRYVGTYVDDGFSGTNTEHRPAFQLMMKRAMAGEIDMIITKSVSRFARNLLDCIGWVEELSRHDPPVRVYFEQENLDTLAQTSNIILFVLAMVAEEESHMKSEAMQLSLEWRFSRGRFLTPELFGYDRVEVPDGYGGRRKVLEINEAEANVVRWLYATLLSGGMPDQMAGVLTDLRIPTKGRRKDGTLNNDWTAGRIVQLMRNERYCGDVLARKTYTPDFKTHKARKNNGKKNQYYQPGHHEAIVTRAQWNAAQRILNSRRYHHRGIYLPIRMIDEGMLAGYIVMNLHWAGYAAEDYYRVSGIAMGILDGKIDADLENEHLPNGGHRISGLLDDHGIRQIARKLTCEEQMIRAELEGQEAKEKKLQHVDVAVQAYQVVSGEMFSRVREPILRISPRGIQFSKSCVERLIQTCDTDCAEFLFNPVERMLVVRPCAAGTVNAIPWDSKLKRATALARVMYESMGWDMEYAYSIPASTLTRDNHTVLVFDMDNYVGRVLSQKKEQIPPRTASEDVIQDNRTDTRGIFYGPEEEEPQSIEDMEDHLRILKELEKLRYGTPAFIHQSNLRGFDADELDGDCRDWDMLRQARPLDIDHSVDNATIEDMLQKIIDHPPLFKQLHRHAETIMIMDEQGDHE